MKRVSHQSDGTYSTHYALTANSVFSGCRMYNTSPLQTTKVKALFYPMLPAFRNSIAFCNVPRIRRFVLLVRAMCRCRWVWSNGWMILTGEERSNRRKTRPSVPLCPPQISHGLIRDWTGVSVMTGRRLNAWTMAGPALKKKQLELYLKIRFVPHSKHSPARL